MAKVAQDGPAKRPGPVPRDRSEQVRAVIALMEDGSSENAACDKVGINRGTFRSAALRCNVADEYARACEALAEGQVATIEAAIADMRNGTIDASMARVEIDTRKWLSSRLFPSRYGDKVAIEHGGAIDHDASKALERLEQSIERILGAP